MTPELTPVHWQAPEAAAPSALEPHPEESDPSLVDRYLPAGRASLQGADGGFQGSYLPNQMPLQRAPSSIGRQDSGRQMHRANSGMSIMPPGSHISMTGAPRLGPRQSVSAQWARLAQQAQGCCPSRLRSCQLFGGQPGLNICVSLHLQQHSILTIRSFKLISSCMLAWLQRLWASQVVNAGAILTWQQSQSSHCLVYPVPSLTLKAQESVYCWHAGSDVDLEGLAQQLQTGSTDERGAAAERLFSHAVESERARSHVAALGVVQPLVCR